MNLGRKPFVYGLPHGCMPIEDPKRPAASWLSRFDHAAETTRTIAQRRALNPRVLDMAFGREVSSSDPRPLPLEVYQMDPVESQFGFGNSHRTTVDETLDDSPFQPGHTPYVTRVRPAFTGSNTAACVLVMFCFAAVAGNCPAFPRMSRSR